LHSISSLGQVRGVFDKENRIGRRRVYNKVEFVVGEV